MFNDVQWKVIHYCAEEVYRQRDDARFVPHMLAAWASATHIANVAGDQPHQVVTPSMLTDWAQMICPIENAKGYRSQMNPINVVVGNHRPPHYNDVPQLLVLFCEAVREGKFLPAEAYKEFELIHPFRDGNGRTGKVFYNFLLGTLQDPVFPPNFFGCSNP